MFRKLLFLTAATAVVLSAGGAGAADRAVPGAAVSERIVKHVRTRVVLPAGLPRPRYRYITTITDGVVPYDARPFAYGRYAYAPYTNSYGIPARVIIDPVDPAAYWRPVPYYASPPYVEAAETSYSCFYYGGC